MSILSMAESRFGKIVAVGENGQSYFSDDYGATWIATVSGTTNNLNGVTYHSYDGFNSWVAVGDNGIIIQTLDGKNWFPLNSGYTEHLNAIAATDSIYAVGDNGTFIISPNSGAQWFPIILDTEEHLRGIDVGTSLYLIVGDNDTIITGNISVSSEGGVLEAHVSERISLSSQESPGGSIYEAPVQELCSCSGSTGNKQFVSLTDRLYSHEVLSDPSGRQSVAVLDLVGAWSFSKHNGAFVQEVISLVKWFDWNAFRHNILAKDAMAMSCDVKPACKRYAVGTSVVDFVSEATTTGVFNLSILQKMSLRDKIFTAFSMLLLDGIATEDSTEYRIEKALRIFERIRAQDSSSSIAHFIQPLAVALSFSEAMNAGKGASTAEEFEVTVSILNSADYYNSLLEQAIVDSTPKMICIARLSLSEEVQSESFVGTSAIFSHLVKDGIAFSISFNAGEDSYTGWVMNTESFAVSEYSNYPFNSFAQIAGKYYGANSNGLYLLEGDTDAGDAIEAYVSLGLTNFGEPRTKRMRAAHIGIRSDGKTLLRVKTDSNDTKYYEIEESKNGLSSKKVPMQRNLLSTYWHFTLENVNGSDFELDSFEFVPVVLNRRG